MASNSTQMTRPLFSLGQVVATPGALELLERFGVNASDLLRRHQSGDWGDLCADDRRCNDEALRDGSRLFSAYCIGRADEKLWVITDAADDSGCRRHTALIRPEDY